MSQCLLRSDTVIYDAATQCPVDELVLTFHLVYRSVCQFPARLYPGHSRTPNHWSQRSLTGRRSYKHIVNLSGVKGSQADGRHLAPQIARVNTALVAEHDFASENYELKHHDNNRFHLFTYKLLSRTHFVGVRLKRRIYFDSFL